MAVVAAAVIAVVSFGVILQQQTYIPCYHSQNIGRLLASNWLLPNQKPVDKWSSLVRIAPQTGGYERVQNIENKESGPKGSRTPDPRHVKAVS